MRRRRPGRSGAETLELMAGLPLLLLVAMLAWQGVLLARQQQEVETDARVLVRHAVLCSGAEAAPQLTGIDAQAGPGATVEVGRSHPPLVSVTVRLRAALIVPGVSLAAGSPLTPTATAVMRQEPC